MIEKKIVKTVRFKEVEMERIETFLEKNSALDFSTLARMAIVSFIEKPDLQLKPNLLKTNEDKRIQ